MLKLIHHIIQDQLDCLAIHLNEEGLYLKDITETFTIDKKVKFRPKKIYCIENIKKDEKYHNINGCYGPIWFVYTPMKYIKQFKLISDAY